MSNVQEIPLGEELVDLPIPSWVFPEGDDGTTTVGTVLVTVPEAEERVKEFTKLLSSLSL